MGKKLFTKEEVEELSTNPYVPQHNRNWAYLSEFITYSEIKLKLPLSTNESQFFTRCIFCCVFFCHFLVSENLLNACEILIQGNPECSLDLLTDIILSGHGIQPAASEESFYGHFKDGEDFKVYKTFVELREEIDSYMDYYNNFRYQ